MDELRGAARAAADLATGHLAGVPDGPVWQPVPEEDRAWLTGQALPTKGRTLSGLLHDVRERVLPHPMGNGHPRFFGWVNSPPSPAGVLVAPLAAAMNPSCAGGDHAGVLLERTAVRWLAELAGYPHPPGGGLLTGGASLATVIALAAARQRAIGEQGGDVREEGLYGRPPLVVYVSQEGHSCLRKAAELLGLGSRYVRTVPVGRDFRMDTEALRRAIAKDRVAGLRPFFVAASAGTVNTGAVDPLDEIAGIAREHGLWFHIDGAYGALGVLDEGRVLATRGSRGRTHSPSTRTSGSASPLTAAVSSSAIRRLPAPPSVSYRPICATTAPTASAGSRSTGPNRPAPSAGCASGAPSRTSGAKE